MGVHRPGRYYTSMYDNANAGLLCNVKADIIQFANKQLEELQPRDDYKEFVELALIFLAEIPRKSAFHDTLANAPYTLDVKCH